MKRSEILASLNNNLLMLQPLVLVSGWAWLVVNKNGQLEVMSTPNQDNPIMEGKTPILGLDVWEHAYYLSYQNRRPEYIESFFNIIDWDVVAEKYEQAIN